MFKIGEFSQLSQVSVRMLRHYEKLGLLLPAHIDESSGYRHYTAGQLSQVQHILTLRGLGFSIAQTARLVGGGLSSEQVVGMMKLKQVELRQQQEENMARLSRVEAHLDILRHTLAAPDTETLLKRIDPLRVVSSRAVMPTYQQGGLLLERLRVFLDACGLPPACSFLSIYHDLEYRPSDIDTEAAYPIPASFAPPALPPGIRIAELPALEMAACATHRGDVNLIGYTYGALGGWVARNGWRLTGPSRVVFRGRDGASGEELREVQWPVAQG